jgi:hypothetical protein
MRIKMGKYTKTVLGETVPVVVEFVRRFVIDESTTGNLRDITREGEVDLTRYRSAITVVECLVKNETELVSEIGWDSFDALQNLIRDSRSVLRTVCFYEEDQEMRIGWALKPDRNRFASSLKNLVSGNPNLSDCGIIEPRLATELQNITSPKRFVPLKKFEVAADVSRQTTSRWAKELRPDQKRKPGRDLLVDCDAMIFIAKEIGHDVNVSLLQD